MRRLNKWSFFSTRLVSHLLFQKLNFSKGKQISWKKRKNAAMRKIMKKSKFCCPKRQKLEYKETATSGSLTSVCTIITFSILNQKPNNKQQYFCALTFDWHVRLQWVELRFGALMRVSTISQRENALTVRCKLTSHVVTYGFIAQTCMLKCLKIETNHFRPNKTPKMFTIS